MGRATASSASAVLLAVGLRLAGGPGRSLGLGRVLVVLGLDPDAVLRAAVGQVRVAAAGRVRGWRGVRVLLLLVRARGCLLLAGVDAVRVGPPRRALGLGLLRVPRLCRALTVLGPLARLAPARLPLARLAPARLSLARLAPARLPLARLAPARLPVARLALP